MKGILLIILLCLLATGKVTVQGFFAKKSVKTLSDGVFFNGMVFLCAALIFLPSAFSASWQTILFGGIFGTLTVVFQATYIKAMSAGKASMAVMIVNLSMVIPILVSVLFYGEPFPVTHIIGVCLTIAAVVISTRTRGGEQKGNTWLWLSLIASFLSGMLSVTQKVYTKVTEAQSLAFTAWTYIIAFLLSAIVYLTMKAGGQPKTFRLNLKAAGSALATGAFLGVVMYFMTYAIATVNGAILFPSYYGGCLVMSTLSGLLILKEKLKPNQIVGISVGVIAIILLNLA